MQQVNVDAHVRQDTGKEQNRKLRKQGQVPAVVYSKGATPLAISLEEKDVRRILAAGAHVVVNLNVVNGTAKKVTAVVQEVQQDQYQKSLYHVDFHQVSLTESVHATVGLTLKGTAPAEKEGGMVDQVLRQIEVDGRVSDIPEKIDIDISQLKVGDAIHVKDLKLPKGIKLRYESDDVVVIVHPPRAEAAAAPAEGATPAT